MVRRSGIFGMAFVAMLFAAMETIFSEAFAQIPLPTQIVGLVIMLIYGYFAGIISFSH